MLGTKQKDVYNVRWPDQSIWHSEQVRRIQENLSYSPYLKFLAKVVYLHEDELAWVRYGGDLLQPFPIWKGAKQGCILAHTLFLVLFSMMLRRATKDMDDKNGVCIQF